MSQRGQGYFYEKQTRQKILQQKAQEFNQKFDQLEDEGHDPDVIHKLIKYQDYEQRHANTAQLTHPYDEHTKVLPLGGVTDLGFKRHIDPSATKMFYKDIEEQFQQTKELKKQGVLVKNPILEEQKKFEKELKERIRFDHIGQLHVADARVTGKKESNYQENYQFNKYMQKECDNQTFENHQLMNDLKKYQEAYIICKRTLRR